MQMVESRRAERVRSFLRAKIVYNNGNSSIDCVIRNISDTGAKIEVSSQLSVPAVFEMEIPQKGRTYRAKIVWRDAEAVGVTFVQPDAIGFAAVPDPKIERLERENRKLRATVVELTKRLESLGQAVDHAF